MYTVTYMSLFNATDAGEPTLWEQMTFNG